MSGSDLANLRREIDESGALTPDERMRAVALQSVVGIAAIPIAAVGALAAALLGGVFGAVLGPPFIAFGAVSGAAGFIGACHVGHARLEAFILRRALARSQRPAQLSSSSAGLPIAVPSSRRR